MAPKMLSKKDQTILSPKTKILGCEGQSVAPKTLSEKDQLIFSPKEKFWPPDLWSKKICFNEKYSMWPKNLNVKENKTIYCRTENTLAFSR